MQETQFRLFDWRAMLGDPTPGKLPGKRLAPKPDGRWFIGQLADIREDLLGATLRWQREYGDVIRVQVGGMCAHLVFHPDAVRQVLQENAKNYNKQTRGFDKLREFLGNGLVTSEGNYWLRQRRIAQPAFHRQRIAELSQCMTRSSEKMVEHWKNFANTGQTVDVSTEMMRLTLQIVGEALLSTDVTSESDSVGKSLEIILRYARQSLLYILSPPLHWPTPENRKVRQATGQLDAIVMKMISDRRAATTRPNDLLTMFMEAKDEETGESMDDRQLRDEVMTAFLAGHETTANALAWTWYLLSKSPVVARKLQTELDTVLAGRAATFDDLPKLQYTKMVIQESMRLFPPVYMIGRKAIGDDIIAGYHIPANTLVFVSPHVTHRHPQFWQDPEGFDPERFLPDVAANRPNFAYFPFGGGPRQCIGNNFALVEAQIVLATLAQHFRLDLVPGIKVQPQPMITLRPANGIPVSIATRSPTSR